MTAGVPSGAIPVAVPTISGSAMSAAVCLFWVAIAFWNSGCETLIRSSCCPLGGAVADSSFEQPTKLPKARATTRRTSRTFEECFIRTSCAGGKRVNLLFLFYHK